MAATIGAQEPGAGATPAAPASKARLIWTIVFVVATVLAVIFADQAVRSVTKVADGPTFTIPGDAGVPPCL